MACPTGAAAPERLSALRPPLDSGWVKQGCKPRAQKMRRGKEEVCVLEIVRPGMEESESAEKQENTGIGPASACRGESAFTRVFHALCARPTGAAAPERLSALRPPSIQGWRSKGANPGCRHAPRERWGVCVADDVARGSRKCGRGYCALAPCGRGRLDVATCENGWGVLAERETPHPFEFVGRPLCPLPQGARAREASAAHFGEMRPARVVPARGTPRRSRRGDPVAGTHNHGLWLWVPALRPLRGRRPGRRWLGPGEAPTCGCTESPPA